MVPKEDASRAPQCFYSILHVKKEFSFMQTLLYKFTPGERGGLLSLLSKPPLSPGVNLFLYIPFPGQTDGYDCENHRVDRRHE